MTNTAQAEIRSFLQECLRAHDDSERLDTTAALFSSGRLDSLHAARLVAFLEERFGLDFVRAGFDIDLLDSLEQITRFVDEHAPSPIEAAGQS